MHTENRHTEINNISIPVCNEFCDSTAAAAVNLSKLACLPDNIGIVKYFSYLSHKFCRSIGRTVFSAAACVFGDNRTIVYIA